MIELINVSKSYGLADVATPVLNGVSLQISQGEFVAIMGPSGSGKSTLLNLIGCLDSIDSGIYHLGGRRVDLLDDDQLTAVRRDHIGFVFQMFNLIPRFSARRNVELPMVYSGIPAAERPRRAAHFLTMVGLGERIEHTPAQLSGGQQQRVAIARALVNNPELIIADEPTGALDTRTGHEIMGLFRTLNRSGKTIIMVTHEEDIAAYARKVVIMKDGRLHSIQAGGG